MNRRNFFAGIVAAVMGLIGWQTKKPARKTMLAGPCLWVGGIRMPYRTVKLCKVIYLRERV